MDQAPRIITSIPLNPGSWKHGYEQLAAIVVDQTTAAKAGVVWLSNNALAPQYASKVS